MARLGELLVSARLLDPEQIERALRAQVLWGGRLGTNLIELGLLDLDGISRALGRKHNRPAALARHFEKADRELQERLSVDLARRWSVVPLLHVGPQKKIAIAVLDPLPAAALDQLAAAFLCTRDQILVSGGDRIMEPTQDGDTLILRGTRPFGQGQLGDEHDVSLARR